MRAQLLALMMSFVVTAAPGQIAASSSAPDTTSGQSLTGSTAGRNLTTPVAPTPIITTPPINPAPATTPTLLTDAPSKPLPPRRSRHTMGTSNTFQNGINGTVNSNAVVNGTPSQPSILQIAPTQSPQQNGTATRPMPATSPDG